MPSSSFTLFESRRSKEVLEIADIFDQLNTRRGPNRHYGLLNGALVLLVSSWEIYCEEVCQIAISSIAGRSSMAFVQLPDRMKRDFVIYAADKFSKQGDPLEQCVAQLPDGGWRLLLEDRLEDYISNFNTPKFSRDGKNLDELFRHVLGIKLSAEINAFLEDDGFCSQLDEVVTLRGEIAHTGEAAPENRLTSAALRKYTQQFVEAAAAIEIILHKEFRSILGFAPWQLTNRVRNSLREVIQNKV